MSERLYKTTIVIYTTEPTMVEGDEWDLETLARETRSELALCESKTCEQVTDEAEVFREVLGFFEIEPGGLNTSPPEDDDDDDDDWRRERAMQAGMMGGCDAYNEAIGSPLGVPAGSRYSDRDDEEG